MRIVFGAYLNALLESSINVDFHIWISWEYIDMYYLNRQYHNISNSNYAKYKISNLLNNHIGYINIKLFLLIVVTNNDLTKTSILQTYLYLYHEIISLNSLFYIKYVKFQISNAYVFIIKQSMI